MKTYVEMIRELREDSDLTQTQIAKVLGIRQNVYSRYECGTCELPIRHLLVLANYYNVSCDYILGRTKKKKLNK